MAISSIASIGTCSTTAPIHPSKPVTLTDSARRRLTLGGVVLGGLACRCATAVPRCLGRAYCRNCCGTLRLVRPQIGRVDDPKLARVVTPPTAGDRSSGHALHRRQKHIPQTEIEQRDVSLDRIEPPP